MHFKQLQIKPRKNSKAPTGFKPMTSAILVQCSTDRAMKPRQKQVKCEFNLYPLHNGYRSWVQILLEPWNFFWALFVTA